MRQDRPRRKQIFEKTDGYCHICHCKLSFRNYGKNGARGAWHIDHSIPRSVGGSDHMNNLFAACIECNIDKGTRSTRTVRRAYGNTRAPYSRARKEKIRENNTRAGAVIGGIVGAIGGPWGMIIGATIGGIIGHDNSPRI